MTSYGGPENKPINPATQTRFFIPKNSSVVCGWAVMQL